jgi:hypothetical protein
MRSSVSLSQRQNHGVRRFISRHLTLLSVLLVLFAVLLAISAGGASTSFSAPTGATFQVTLASDSGPVDQGQADPNTSGSGDLRWCIVQANQSPGATIDFAAVPNPNNQPITLAAPLPFITATMTFRRHRVQHLCLSGNHRWRRAVSPILR